VLAYLIKRTAGSVPRLLLITLVLFALVHLPAGGPADLYAADPSASPEAIKRMRALWGLDDPLPVQYGRWLLNALSGNWGQSFAERRPARDVVVERVGNTLWLTGGALLVGLLFGVPLGAWGAVTQRGWLKRAVQGVSVIGMSVPTFWSGTLVILFFSVYLRWIPPGGMGTYGAGFSLLDRLWHLLAPALVLGSVYVAQWARYVQAGLEEALHTDHARTARAKGLGSVTVVWRHAFPNVAIPFVTVLGLEAPRLLSGAMVTEVVFTWPGLGRLLTESLLSRDYPVVMGALMLLSAAVVLVNLLTDLAYGWLDPRIRYE